MREQVGWCHRQLARREERAVVVASFLGVIFSGELRQDEMRVAPEVLELRLEIAEGEAGAVHLRGAVDR